MHRDFSLSHRLGRHSTVRPWWQRHLPGLVARVFPPTRSTEFLLTSISSHESCSVDALLEVPLQAQVYNKNRCHKEQHGRIRDG